MSVDVQDPETSAATETRAPQPLSSEGDSKALSRTGAMSFGIAPKNFDEAWRIARIFAESELVPKQYRDKPGDVLVAMQYGAEIGLPPMASLQSVAVINGRPGVHSDGFLGVIQSKPTYLKHVEYYVLADGTQVKGLPPEAYNDDRTKAVTIFWRRGVPEPFEGEFSIADAKRAKLWTKEGPWTQYPARMLRWRAREYAGRDGFAAELRGIQTTESLRDLPPEDSASDVSVLLSEPVRRSLKPATAAEETRETPSTDAPQSPAEPAPDAPTQTASMPPLSKPATRPAKSSTAAPPPSGSFRSLAPAVTTKNMVITETFHVTPKDADPHFEVRATVKEKNKAPIGFVFLTTDEAIYKRAASCEGTDALFDITWQGAKRLDGASCKVLVAIEAAG